MTAAAFLRTSAAADIDVLAVSPLWSACPFCRRRIAWYDNLPIISFLALRGRCRHCDVPIPTRYLVIEVLMGLIVLVLLDTFFIGHVREGLCTARFGLTDQLSFDWPILVAHIILFACLIALSAIDLEHYWVDIRFTNFVVLAGFALLTTALGAFFFEKSESV